jgi:large subunit ribosomal protein L19
MAEEAQKTDIEASDAPKKVAETAAPAAQSSAGKAIADWNKIEPGMIVKVHQKIKETTPKGEERERVQIFEGTVIAKKGKDANSATITVRKIASGVGVERIFPLKLPTLAKIEEVKRLKVRRSKLYFLRTHKKHLKEKK